MSLIRFKINNKDCFIDTEEWEKERQFFKNKRLFKMRKLKLNDEQAIKLIRKTCEKYPESVKRIIYSCEEGKTVTYQCRFGKDTGFPFNGISFAVSKLTHIISVYNTFYGGFGEGENQDIHISETQFNELQELFEHTIEKNLKNYISEYLGITDSLELAAMLTNEE